MSYMRAGMAPAGADSPVTSFSAPSDREDRLESMIRQMLPGMNIATMPANLRCALFREFSELRAGGAFAQDVHFSNGRSLISFQENLLSTVDVEGVEGILMRVPEEDAGAEYLLLVPSLQVLSALKQDDICLREACLDEQSRLYLADDMEAGVARILRGEVHEFLLPEEGLFLSEFFTELEDPEPSMEM